MADNGDIFVDKQITNHMRDLYGLNPDIVHPALQFPRLPPARRSNPMFGVYENPLREQITRIDAARQRLAGFQHMYQQYASSLLTMNSTVIPPGHPAYTRQNSMETLQIENDKLLKENLELKKKIKRESE